MKKKYLIFFCLIMVFQSFFCRITNTETQEKKTSLKPGLNNKTMWHDGIEREFDVHLPANFDIKRSYPVVFCFHGFGGTKEFGEWQIGSLINEKEVIGVYPQGVQRSWNTGMGEIPSTADDVGFTLEMLKWIKKEINIDENRIYTMGYSNGGTISYRLVLETEVFAAMGSISASMFLGQTINPEVKKVSVIQVHGSEDRKVPYEGGRSSALDISFESALSSMELWAEHNGLNIEPEIDSSIEDVTIYTFRKEDSPLEVVLYTFEGATHHMVDHYYFENTSEIILDFFEKHPKTPD